MKKAILAGALLLATLTGARADMIGGWEVTAEPGGDNLCTATYKYIDKNDDNVQNAVILVVGKLPDDMLMTIVTVAYGKWEWDKTDKPKADLMVGRTVFARDVAWDVQGPQVLLSAFMNGDEALQAMSRGSEIVLRFDGDDSEKADFRTPEMGQVAGALKFCANKKKG